MGDFSFGCWARHVLDSSGPFVFEVHAHQGVDYVGLFLFLLQFHCLSQRRAGGGYALRVSPAANQIDGLPPAPRTGEDEIRPEPHS